MSYVPGFGANPGEQHGSDIDFFVEPMYAWRAFRIIETGNGINLKPAGLRMAYEEVDEEGWFKPATCIRTPTLINRSNGDEYEYTTLKVTVDETPDSKTKVTRAVEALEGLIALVGSAQSKHLVVFSLVNGTKVDPEALLKEANSLPVGTEILVSLTTREAPVFGCSCGYWAAYTRKLLGHVVPYGNWEHPEYVVALVEVKGRVVLGEYGLRAEYMRIVGVISEDIVYSAKTGKRLDISEITNAFPGETKLENLTQEEAEEEVRKAFRMVDQFMKAKTYKLPKISKTAEGRLRRKYKIKWVADTSNDPIIKEWDTTDWAAMLPDGLPNPPFLSG